MKKLCTSTLILDEDIDPGLFYGNHDGHLNHIEQATGIHILARGSCLRLRGETKQVRKAEAMLASLMDLLHQQAAPTQEEINHLIAPRHAVPEDHFPPLSIPVSGRKPSVIAKSTTQADYIQAIQTYSVVVGIGPAGTGKTYLAMALAVSALQKRDVEHIILARPAVEAGERLGFLPGDLSEKVHPYLRPLYDALYDMMEPARVRQLIERGDIEIAPLAFMRGRTLNHAFIILDEAQNTTPDQMKMFLTRLGQNAKVVITGDITQVDLPQNCVSGLIEIQQVLKAIPEIKFVHFTEEDTVRSPLVREIVHAYAQYTSQRTSKKK